MHVRLEEEQKLSSQACPIRIKKSSVRPSVPAKATGLELPSAPGRDRESMPRQAMHTGKRSHAETETCPGREPVPLTSQGREL